jgi:hypothetical protein
MNKKQVEDYIQVLKEKYGVRIYTPYKYFKGLSKKSEIKNRFQEMMAHRVNPGSVSYSAFKTDSYLPKGEKRPSNYTLEFYKRFGEQHKSLSSKSRVTGVPLSVIEEVYRRGMAAWKTGHRVGATQQEWAYARVHSFLTLGCTLFGPDFDLFSQAEKKMQQHKLCKWLSQSLSCTRAQFLQSNYYKHRIDHYNYVMKLKKKCVDINS